MFRTGYKKNCPGIGRNLEQHGHKKHKLIVANIHIHGYSQPNRHFSFEITEDYDGDWRIVIFEKVDDEAPYEHIDSVIVNTEKEVFDLIRQYHEGKK